jgi:hypothetical protein
VSRKLCRCCVVALPRRNRRGGSFA